MFTLHFRSLIVLFLLVISTVYVVVWNIDWSFGVMIAEGIYLFLFCSLLILAILNMKHYCPMCNNFVGKARDVVRVPATPEA